MSEEEKIGIIQTMLANYKRQKYQIYLQEVAVKKNHGEIKRVIQTLKNVHGEKILLQELEAE